jgi:prepilin-type N-terminal cleavage/methylation domain-containing protein
MNNYKRGFTLIELLMTIGIIAVLVTVVILVINPVELMKQSRDAIRIEDLNTLSKAVNFYITNAETPNLGNPTKTWNPVDYIPTGDWDIDINYQDDGWCYISIDASSPFVIGLGSDTCFNRFSRVTDGGPDPKIRTANSRAVDGTGWIPINFNEVSSLGSPISILPIDPIKPNSTGLTKLFLNTAFADLPPDAVNDDHYYAYGTDGIEGFEINAKLESTKYATKASNDGGDNALLYEVGNIPGLNL